VPFREDATNAQLDIQRNHIRHELIPSLRKRHQPALERVILRQMELIGAESEFVTKAAVDWLSGKRLPAFEKLPVALQRRCLQLQLLEKKLPVSFDLIEELRAFPNRSISVTVFQHPILIQRDMAGIVHVSEPTKPSFAQGSLKIHLQGRGGEILFENARIEWKPVEIANGTFRARFRGVNHEIFDAAKVGSDIVLRHWRAGDRFQPIGMPKSVKLQDLFINLKVPRAMRHELLVGTTAGGEIFWVEGLRMAECFKLDKKTVYGLKWRWERL
jgi:tRNA(Ile)-lysidine synthase